MGWWPLPACSGSSGFAHLVQVSTPFTKWWGFAVIHELQPLMPGRSVYNLGAHLQDKSHVMLPEAGGAPSHFGPPNPRYGLPQTLACGLLGIPPVNGVLSQAPMHTRSLITLQEQNTLAALRRKRKLRTKLNSSVSRAPPPAVR